MTLAPTPSSCHADGTVTSSGNCGMVLQAQLDYRRGSTSVAERRPTVDDRATVGCEWHVQATDGSAEVLAELWKRP